ncbi:MAG TPA: hypothetical protein VEZ48_14640 [Sphingomonadaceae bacterium]|nr:hypothetical protein [Sphingomonadaceae bacterium]
MNAISPIDAPTADRRWFEATNAANAWRGRCLNTFARAEAAVSETLLAMSGVGGRGSGVKLPYLVGQKFETLAAAIGPEGPFASEGQVVANTLAGFRTYDHLRAFLCHGDGKIALDQRGAWLLVMRLPTFGSKLPERTFYVAFQKEADELALELGNAGKRLGQQLCKLRADLTSKP